MPTAKKKDDMVRSVITVQVIHYCCSNCGEEIEEMKSCPSCKAPMRVLQVKELYGDEATKFLESLKSNQDDGDDSAKLEDLGTIEGSMADESVLTKLDVVDAPGNPKSKSVVSEVDELSAFGEIFSDDDEEETAPSPKAKKASEDFSFLDELDKDEGGMDDVASDFEALKEL